MKKTFSVIIILFVLPILFISSYQQDEIDELLELAKSATELDNYVELIKIYDKILEIEPNNVQALNGKGGTLFFLSRMDEGIVLIDKALEIEPNFVPALMNKGNSLGLNENIDEALEYFERALQIDPENLKVLFNKANALKTKDPNKSIKTLDKILEIDHNNKRAIIEKTNLLNLFGNHRNDGFIQVVLRNSNGQLIGYLESDVIRISNYEKANGIIVKIAEHIESFMLNDEEFYNIMIGDEMKIDDLDSKSMRTGLSYIFGTVYPQDEEITFEGVRGKVNGYLIEEGDHTKSVFQFLFPKSDFAEKEPK